MVPASSSPSLSRRRLLGAVAGGTALVGGGTLVAGATNPTALPNVVADWATNYYPTPPERSALWRPTVTEDHARDAVALLDDTDDEANTLRSKLDDDDFRFFGPGGWLDDAEASLENGDYDDALFEARYGLQFAGEGLGKVNAELGEADLEEFADRSVELFDRIDALVQELRSYPVREPARDLAWYVEIESELQHGRSLANWHGLEAVRDGSAADAEISTSDPHEIGEIESQLLRAEIAVETAERYHDRLSDRPEGTDAEYRDHLESVLEALRDDLESMPTRDEVTSRYIDDDVETYGPYEFAHSRLAGWCFPTSISPPWKQSVDDDFLVVRVLGTARGLVDWRAHEYAVDELAVKPDDEGFDPGHVLAEKRRAKSTFDRTVGSEPTPFLAVLAEQGIGGVRAADIRRDSWGNDDHWTAWRERVQTYLHALLGRARLREYPAVYDRIVDEE